MANSGNPEGEIVRDIPDNMAAVIGRIGVCYALMEHKLSAVAGLLLQLNKAEMRIALRMPRAVDRLDIALDLFAIRNIFPRIEVAQLRSNIEAACSQRDNLLHGLWLRHPETNELFLRLTRGKWPKNLSDGDAISRAVYPQAIQVNLSVCEAALAKCEQALEGVESLGGELDHALHTYPERFRQPSPLIDPLGRRKPKEPPVSRTPSRRKPKEI